MVSTSYQTWINFNWDRMKLIIPFRLILIETFCSCLIAICEKFNQIKISSKSFAESEQMFTQTRVACAMLPATVSREIELIKRLAPSLVTGSINKYCCAYLFNDFQFQNG